MATPEPSSDNRPPEPARGGNRGYGSYGSYGNYGGGNGGNGYGNYGSYNRGGAGEGNPIQNYLLMLRERYWWILLSTLVFVTLALLNTYNTVPEYRATGRLRVFRLAPTINGGSSAADDNFKIVSNDDFFTAVEAMRSANIIEGVSKRLTATELKSVLEPYQAGNIFSGPLTPQEVFAKQRGINPQRQTLVINVDFTHPNRDLARQVARLFCDSIKKYSEDDRLMVTNPLVEKARIEIETLEDKVRRLYEQKNDLIKNQKLLSIAKDTNTLTTERSVLVKDREETRKQIDENEILVSVIASYEKENRPLGDIPQIRADSDVAAAQTAISASKIRVSQMTETYTDQHPKLVAEREALKQLDHQLKEAVGQAIKTRRSALENAKARLEAILRNLLAKEEEFSKLQAANVELERVDKDIKASEEFLSRMKLSYEEAKLRSSTSGTSTSISILDAPSVSDKPINKNYYFNSLVGMGSGLLFGIVLIIAIGTLDDRIKSAKDVEGSLGLPLIGTIPRVANTAGPDRALLARQDKDRIATEAVRSIYSALKVNPAVSKARVFLVTSTRPSEGKTFVVTNLALIFAQHSERVLVIDADLRLPNVGPSLGFTGDGGLSKWFNAETSLDEAIVRDVAPGLDVLPVGLSCKNPTQVINNPKFLAMIDELRGRYDRIFIDSPPIGAVSDALHLLPKVDGVLYVVRYNTVNLRNATSCLARLREAQAPMLGVVLNAMSLRMASAYTDTYDSSYRKYYVDEPRGQAGPESKQS
ncbi:MAG: polysaccharide biosynthesis tyrosine autokinase [Verrucomicrobia bacterium]|nr:polysaccharide biosynthesis tyrosine autokinase [Verrucomicrobiota bacterium]